MTKVKINNGVTSWVEDSKDRPHGVWVRKEDRQTYWYECSICAARPPRDMFGREYFSNYCPDCGAEMSKE